MKLIAVTTAQLRQHQRKLVQSFIVVLVLGGLLLFFFGMSESVPPKTTMSTEAPLHDVTKTVEDKSFWMFQAEEQIREAKKKQEQLAAELEALKKMTVERDHVSDEENIQALKQRIEQLEMAHSTEARENPLSEMALFKTRESLPDNDASTLNQAGETTPGIFSESMDLTLTENKLPQVDSYIPAGSYAKAVLLSGVDVSAAISSQTNPQPVLLRLVHKGNLPNKAVGRMKDCRLIASAYGELSSERAYMRLEKLSCVEPDGRVIETAVDGYISGEDGKNGLRGRVVIRDAEVLQRGFMGGLLSGLGKASSQSFNSTSISPIGTVSTSTAKGSDIFKQAGAEGAGDAFELMAKYNIQRAEQYQPVIQISAGRAVEVVFHSGSSFGEKKLKNKKRETPFLPHSGGEE